MQDAFTNSRGTRVAVVAGQGQHAGTVLGQATGTADDAAECQGKGLGINGSSTIQRNGIGKVQINTRGAERGAGAHDQRAGAERVVVPHAQNALLQEGATRVAVVTGQCQN